MLCSGSLLVTCFIWVYVLVAQLCLTHCDPMDCSPPGSSVHGILQARILEWVAIPFSRGSSNAGIEHRSPALQMDSLLSEPPGKADFIYSRGYMSFPISQFIPLPLSNAY